MGLLPKASLTVPIWERVNGAGICVGPPKPPVCERTPRARIVTLVELKDWADIGCDPFAVLANEGVKTVSVPKGVVTPSA